ncbi:hypothetical protein BGZ97_003830 [Linnemannia gamsii]|uniref:Uncharacterized protein n=1 Tax=Linnemannia gamsii TaxID=64522 RepID=A0A9P6QV15_9FUNG|nr:hypothetical protein BGZ97_003830 [Linnemannia gamsii]
MEPKEPLPSGSPPSRTLPPCHTSSSSPLDTPAPQGLVLGHFFHTYAARHWGDLVAYLNNSKDQDSVENYYAAYIRDLNRIQSSPLVSEAIKKHAQKLSSGGVNSNLAAMRTALDHIQLRELRNQATTSIQKGMLQLNKEAGDRLAEGVKSNTGKHYLSSLGLESKEKKQRKNAVTLKTSPQCVQDTTFHTKARSEDDTKEQADPGVAAELPETPPIRLDLFSRVNQEISWTSDGHNILELFRAYQSKNQQIFELARDDIADLSGQSGFALSLTAEQLGAALVDISPIQWPHEVWPSLKDVISRVLNSQHSFDDSLAASRAESMQDPVAEYIHGILYSYSKYFRFSDRIPADLREHEGFSDMTWAVIGGALTLAGVETRYLEVPVKAVEERKNAHRNPFLDTKAQAHMADGVAFRGPYQIYLAEASALSQSDTNKRSEDEFKLKRDLRDTFQSQLKDICEDGLLPPRSMRVFGSTSFNARTMFYALDFMGVFRLHEIRSMILPLNKSTDFTLRLKRCVLVCLEVALMIKEELDRRESADPIPQGQKQLLVQACNQMQVTTRTPTKPKKQK